MGKVINFYEHNAPKSEFVSYLPPSGLSAKGLTASDTYRALMNFRALMDRVSDLLLRAETFHDVSIALAKAPTPPECLRTSISAKTARQQMVSLAEVTLMRMAERFATQYMAMTAEDREPHQLDLVRIGLLYPHLKSMAQQKLLLCSA